MRISKKVVLEYLESVYPTWKTFSQIADDVPVTFNFDFFELQDRLDRLYLERKIEKGASSYRFVKKEKRK